MTSRNIAIALHVNRADAVEAAAEFVAALSARGITCYLRPDAIEVVRPRLEGTVDLRPYGPVDPGVIELVVVFGGDGTILRAAE